jgi:hypothetical protein
MTYKRHFKAEKKPDVIRCGSGTDEVIYEKGLNRVVDDCEISCPCASKLM